MSHRADADTADGDADAFVQQVIRVAAAVRLASLLSTPRPGSLYRMADRHGVSIVAVPATSLTSEEVAGLLAFRFAQYLDIGFVDRRIAYESDMVSEPAAVSAPGDVHVVAGVPETGEILCYAVIEGSPAAKPGCRLRSPDRELFRVERVHGAGIFNRLPILPDLPVAKIREVGRFVRNTRPTADRDLVVRAVVETGVALFRVVAGPLRDQVDALVGDLEEQVAKQNLDFFHIPLTVVHATVPYASNATYLYPRYLLHTVYPFAFLTSDIATALPRLDAIEQALQRPGKRGLLALLRLRSQTSAATSMLRNPEDIDPVQELGLTQPQIGMPQRKLLLELGAWLRRSPEFAGLSVAEAAMLSALMRRVEVPAGHVIARQGATAEALYVVERGRANVELESPEPDPAPVYTLGPGQCCGVIGVLSSAPHPVSVIAATEMSLLRLSKTDYDTYLARIPDIDQNFGHDALRRLADIERHRRAHSTPPAPAAPGHTCGCGDTCTCAHDHPAAANTANVTTPEFRVQQPAGPIPRSI